MRSTQPWRGIGIDARNLELALMIWMRARAMASQVSATTISDVDFSGTLADQAFIFTPGGVSNFGTMRYFARMILTKPRPAWRSRKVPTRSDLAYGHRNELATAIVVGQQQLRDQEPPPQAASFRVNLVPIPWSLRQAWVSIIKGIGVGYDVTFGITPIPPGDYNKNGVVDAADYVLWRKGDLAADSNGDTVVDQTDYDFWRARFGNPNPGAGAGLSSTSVPEPAALTLLVIGLLATCSGRRGKLLRTRTI